MIAHLHKYVKFTSKIITCKTFLKNVLTYIFDYGTFKMQKQDKGVNEMQKVKFIGKVIIGIIIILGILALNIQYGKASYDRCIKNGQDEAVCRELLN